jgi:hypothetical protein
MGTAPGHRRRHRNPGALHRGDRLAAKLAGGSSLRPDTGPDGRGCRRATRNGTGSHQAGFIRRHAATQRRVSVQMGPGQLAATREILITVPDRRECCRRPASATATARRPEGWRTCGSKVLASFTISHEGRQEPRADSRRGVPDATRKGFPAPSPGGDARLIYQKPPAGQLPGGNAALGPHWIDTASRLTRISHSIDPFAPRPCYHGASRRMGPPRFVSRFRPERR